MLSDESKARLEQLKDKLKVREGTAGFKANVMELKKEIAKLEGEDG